MRPRSAAASVRGVRHLWLPQELPVGRLGRLVELQQDLRPGAAGGRHFAAPRAGRDRRFWGGGLRGPCCAHHTLQRAALPGGLRVEGLDGLDGVHPALRWQRHAPALPQQHCRQVRGRALRGRVHRGVGLHGAGRLLGELHLGGLERVDSLLRHLRRGWPSQVPLRGRRGKGPPRNPLRGSAAGRRVLPDRQRVPSGLRLQRLEGLGTLRGDALRTLQEAPLEDEAVRALWRQALRWQC
mmetsp:Transcript_24543/g.58220  ORF Transcript_24543/g.58220 Transcript_24543/m.58220 type:complete len:239 (-) Transcript_24543:285-1001(-)